MAKTRRRRPPNRTKRRPPTRDAAPRLGGDYTSAPTRTFVSPSRRARRASMLRAGAVGGLALGLLIGVFLVVSRGGDGGGSKLATKPLTAKVLSPTVRFRASSGGDLTDLASSDKVREKAIVETDATGLGEFRYADGSLVRVGPSSKYSLTRSRSEGGKRDIAGRLEAGRTWHRVTPGFGEASDYEVNVLGATGKVIGTALSTVCPVETDCFYTVIKGHMKVQDAADREADLRAGDQVEVKFGRLDPVKHLSDADIAADPWIVQNLTLDGDSAPAVETTTTLSGDTTTTLFGATTITSTGGPLPKGTTTTRRTTGSTSPSPGTTSPSPGTTTPPTTEPPATTTTAPATTTTKHCDKRPKPPGCP